MHTPHRIARGGILGAAGMIVALLAACGGSSTPAASGSSSPSGGSASPAAGASSSAPGQTTKVTVGVIPIIDVAPLYLGIKNGIFLKHGLEVTPQPAQGGAAIVPAVMTGQNQFGFSNVISLMIAREKGLKLVATNGGSTSTGDPKSDVNAVLVGKDSTLQSAKDLEGKKVAINSLHNIGDITISTAVKKAGGDPTKVQFVEMPFPDMPAALSSGKIDAAWESEPFRSQILGAGGRILFDNLTETYPKLQIAVYFTSEKLKQENPKLVKDFTEALDEALTYAGAHPDEARAILATYTKIPAEAAAKVILPAWPTGLDDASATAVGSAAQSFGTLKNAPDVAGLYAH